MKFKIEKEDKKVAKLIRLPESLVLEIDKYISKNDISFTKFVIEACIYAIENMDDN